MSAMDESGEKRRRASSGLVPSLWAMRCQEAPFARALVTSSGEPAGGLVDEGSEQTDGLDVVAEIAVSAVGEGGQGVVNDGVAVIVADRFRSALQVATRALVAVGVVALIHVSIPLLAHHLNG